MGLVRPQGEPYTLLGRGGGEGGRGESGISVKRDEGCRGDSLHSGGPGT